MLDTRTRRWLVVASIGFGVILLAMAVVALTIFFKKQFSWLVGSGFLASVVIMVLGGSIAMLIAAAVLPFRRTWRTYVLIAWGTLALTSPLFGWIFLIPWTVLLFTSPVIFSILRHWFRGSMLAPS